MKAVFEKLQPEISTSFLIRKFELRNFDAPFHFHPEYELTLILEGEGLRYVGKQVHNFVAGDLIFLGSNLPHCWLNEPNEKGFVSAIVIQFGEDFWGKDFINLPEMGKINNFLIMSKSGCEILGKTKEIISKGVKSLIDKTPIQKIIGLIDILDTLSLSDELAVIDSYFFEHHYNYSETARFQKVFSYLIENFKENISLDTMADISGLSTTSFCRYFKGITQKTLVEVLIDYRLQYACQLLQKTDLPIRQVAFESGFGDVPYFNKVFKKHKKMNPNSFRKLI